MSNERSYSDMTVLVVGAAQYSLGDEVAKKLRRTGYKVVTAGLRGSGEMACDLRSSLNCETLLNEVKPDHIVCTAGVNPPTHQQGSLNERNFGIWLYKTYETNVIGPMQLLRSWVPRIGKQVASRDKTAYHPHYVVISSNSARIARSNSLAYCASKAALSMAVRCVARELGGDPCLVYGYEPGLLTGTPMTMQVQERFGDSPTRMVGAPEGVHVPYAADVIARTLRTGGVALNGVLIPLDAGEQ